VTSSAVDMPESESSSNSSQYNDSDAETPGQTRWMSDEEWKGDNSDGEADVSGPSQLNVVGPTS
jgi:hypothetical protein